MCRPSGLLTAAYQLEWNWSSISAIQCKTTQLKSNDFFPFICSVRTRGLQTPWTSSSRHSECTSTSPEPSCSSRSGTPWRRSVGPSERPVSPRATKSVGDGLVFCIYLPLLTSSLPSLLLTSQMTGPLCCWQTTTLGRQISKSPPQWPTQSTTSLCPRPLDHWWTCPTPGLEPVSPTTVSAQYLFPFSTNIKNSTVLLTIIWCGQSVF